uniref:Phospholipase A1 n=1 Tax=Solanum tuberosum TaxID=4113 RepID=M1BT36_SOLTU
MLVKVKKIVVLVNKSSSSLKDEFLIPWLWWVEKNKGMIFDENEEWILAPPILIVGRVDF